MCCRASLSIQSPIQAQHQAPLQAHGLAKLQARLHCHWETRRLHYCHCKTSSVKMSTCSQRPKSWPHTGSEVHVVRRRTRQRSSLQTRSASPLIQSAVRKRLHQIHFFGKLGLQSQKFKFEEMLSSFGGGGCTKYLLLRRWAPPFEEVFAWCVSFGGGAWAPPKN